MTFCMRCVCCAAVVNGIAVKEEIAGGLLEEEQQAVPSCDWGSAQHVNCCRKGFQRNHTEGTLAVY